MDDSRFLVLVSWEDAATNRSTYFLLIEMSTFTEQHFWRAEEIPTIPGYIWSRYSFKE